ncbi:MAG: hypothetical protein QXV32_04850 [Conexivisphaerales archaeon]
MLESYGMPDQIGSAFGMSLKAAKILRLVLAILVAILLTVLVLISQSLNLITEVILSVIWLFVILIAASSLDVKQT